MKAKTSPTTDIPRLEPSIEQGLSFSQVELRKGQGAVNVSRKKMEKSVLAMLLSNIFTPFNIALFAIAIIFLAFIIYLKAAGRNDVVQTEFGFSKFGFLIPAVVNSTIGSVQEIHGKRVLAKLRLVNQAKAIVLRDGQKNEVFAEEIVLDDIVFLSAGEQCLADCILKSGEIQVDESMLTGESDLVRKVAGDVVYAGSSVLVGSGYAQVDKVGDETYASSLSDKVKQLPRHRSELMTSINKIIVRLAYAIVIVVAVVFITLCIKITMYGGSKDVFGTDYDLSLTDAATWGKMVVTAGAFAVGMIPEGLVMLTSIALALSIIKLAKQKTLIQELYSLENLSRVDTICLDKTGTLTDGTMNVVDETFYEQEEFCIECLKKLLGAFEETNPTSLALMEKYGSQKCEDIASKIPFSSAKKHSGIVLKSGETILLGAPEYIASKDQKGKALVEENARNGKRVLALTLNDKPLAYFVLEDHIRSSAKDTIAFFYENHVDVKIISGDNLLTVSKIASLCGVAQYEKGISLEGISLEDIPPLGEEYTVFARVSPEQKLAIVEALQQKGRKVAMTGDGVNDILALRKSDASITFAKATDAAKSCSDVVLLDNDFSHLKEVVGQGRRVVNNIERSAVLFLMKTTAIIGLAFFLIPFKKGQFWYSVENIYLLQHAVIGIGGLLLSLEPHKEPIRGRFLENVIPKAIVSGVLILLAALLPLVLCRAPASFGGEPLISEGNAKSLISILTFSAGLSCAIAMCHPYTKYRAVCLALMGLVGAVLAFGLPTSYVGGLVTSSSMFVSPDGNFFHSPFFTVAFQPWNSEVMVSLGNDYRVFLIMGGFFLLLVPGYFLLFFHLRKNQGEKC